MPFDAQRLNGFCGQHEGQRQHLIGFAGGITKHHALITCTMVSIDTEGNNMFTQVKEDFNKAKEEQAAAVKPKVHYMK